MRRKKRLASWRKTIRGRSLSRNERGDTGDKFVGAGRGPYVKCFLRLRVDGKGLEPPLQSGVDYDAPKGGRPWGRGAPSL